MRMPALGLALSSIVACGSPPAEVTTDPHTTESAPTSGSPSTSNPDDTAGPTSGTMTSADTGEEVCPPMPPEDGSYDQCPGLCGGGGQCFNDPGEFAVCTRGCFMDCNCWPAPEGDGDAPVRCSSALLETTSVCVLDCSGGESCPSGMFCVADLGICAHPYPGTETGSSSSDGGTTEMGTSSGSSSDGGSSSSSGESSSDSGSSSSGESSSDGGSSSSGGSSSDSGSGSSGSSSDSGTTASTT